MHRLDFRVLIVEPLQRPDSEQLAVGPGTVEGDGGVQQALDSERMDVLRRSVFVGEREVALKKLADVIRPWVIDRDLNIRHDRDVRQPKPARNTWSTADATIVVSVRRPILNGHLAKPSVVADRTAGMADTSRPQVVVSVGMSVDARVTLRRDTLLLDEKARRLIATGMPASAERLEDTRQALIASLYKPRVILEGSGTFVTNDVGPVTDLPPSNEPDDVLYDDFLPTEVLEHPDHIGWFTVVDSRGRVRWTMKRAPGLDWDLLVLVARATPRNYLAFLRRERICYLVVGEERVDLLTAVCRMRHRLGVDCVVSKAGGGLNGALLRAGLIDELHLLISPTAIGGLGTPTLFDGPELAPGQPPTALRLLAAHVETDGMLSLRYQIDRDT